MIPDGPFTCNIHNGGDHVDVTTFTSSTVIFKMLCMKGICKKNKKKCSSSIDYKSDLQSAGSKLSFAFVFICSVEVT